MVICHKKSVFTKLCFTNLDSKVWDEDGKQKKRDFITFEIEVFIFKGFQLKFCQIQVFSSKSLSPEPDEMDNGN